ncbi:hypothetical protein EVA_04228, partial [gut metagenome]
HLIEGVKGAWQAVLYQSGTFRGVGRTVKHDRLAGMVTPMG